jgi:ParB/RepB/Spo0J family partition protein
MPPRKKTAPQPPGPAAPPAGDSAGISPAPGAVLVMVKLAELAPHPRNPRRHLGDLDELTASIRADGLFEPVVIISAEAFTAAAAAAGDPERLAGEGTGWVTLMGHRRAAAAAAAGLAEVPAVIRDDLAGQARAKMIAENLHREGLTPLEEAEGMAELAAAGWGQRRIAAEIGCSQAHVSKRLALLQLPEPARDGIAAGQLTVADGLELHKLYGGGRDAAADTAIGQAVDSITRGYPAEPAVRQAQAGLRRARAEQETRDKLAAEGVQVVTEQQQRRLGWPRVYGDTAPHAKAGCLAAAIGYHGDAEYLCTNPAGHPGTTQNREARRDAERRETERESRRAAKARDAACQQIAAGPLPSARDLTQLLATTVLTGSGGGYSEALRLAWRWLRDSGAVQAGATTTPPGPSWPPPAGTVPRCCATPTPTPSRWTSCTSAPAATAPPAGASGTPPTSTGSPGPPGTSPPHGKPATSPRPAPASRPAAPCPAPAAAAPAKATAAAAPPTAASATTATRKSPCTNAPGAAASTASTATSPPAPAAAPGRKTTRTTATTARPGPPRTRTTEHV